MLLRYIFLFGGLGPLTFQSWAALDLANNYFNFHSYKYDPVLYLFLLQTDNYFKIKKDNLMISKYGPNRSSMSLSPEKIAKVAEIILVVYDWAFTPSFKTTNRCFEFGHHIGAI